MLVDGGAGGRGGLSLLGQIKMPSLKRKCFLCPKSKKTSMSSRKIFDLFRDIFTFLSSDIEINACGAEVTPHQQCINFPYF